MSRHLDDLFSSAEHAEQAHPFKNLVAHGFYLEGLVTTEGGLWLMMLDALLLLPLVLAAFFYPVEALIVAGAVVAATLLGWEGYVVWRRRHQRA